MTQTGYIDSCFFDHCMKHEGQEWNEGWLDNKLASMVDIQSKVDGPVICGSNGNVVSGIGATQLQNWGILQNPSWSTREIPMLMEAVKANVIFEAHGKCPKDPNDPYTVSNIAAFLIAAGPYSYYMCGGWSNEPPTWYPIYDLPLGKPLSNATLGKDGVWRRSFKSGTSVTFNTNTEAGTIHWAA